MVKKSTSSQIGEVEKVYIILKTKMESNNGAIFDDVSKKLAHITSQIYSSSVSASDKGFCFKFTLPIIPVQGLFKCFDLDPIKVEEAFRSDWKYPKNTKMYSDSYYHILLLLMKYGIDYGKKNLLLNSLFLILIKIWNGRLSDFIPYCDIPTMKYVTTVMTSKKYYASKFDTPISLLSQHFVPTLLTKYSDDIHKDINKLKSFFSQCYNRIYQLFSQQGKINPVTGDKEKVGGLAHLYYKAKKDGLVLKSQVTFNDKDEDGISKENDSSYDKYGSVNQFDEVSTNIADNMTMSQSNTYPEQFIENIHSNTRVGLKLINLLIKCIHDHKHYEQIKELLALIFHKSAITSKDLICSAEFMKRVKDKVIASKNNPDTTRINELIDEIALDTFTKNNTRYNSYSTVQKIQIRTACTYLFIYNIKKVICKDALMQRIKSFKLLGGIRNQSWKEVE